jgi:hypothetical protein
VDYIDVELVIDYLLQIFKDDLNTQILAMNAKKADSIVLSEIDNTKYVFNNFPASIMNQKVSFVWGLEPFEISDENEAAFIEKTTMTFEVVISDPGEIERLNVLKRLLRYTEALKAVVRNNPDVLQGFGKVVPRSLEPNGFMLKNTLFLSAGISISASIAS